MDGNTAEPETRAGTPSEPNGGTTARSASLRQARSRLLQLIWSDCRWPIALAIFASLLGAISEGVTVAVFGLALDAITGDGTLRLSSRLGFAGPPLDRAARDLGQVGFFFALVAAGVSAQILRSLLAFSSGAAAAYVQSRTESRLRRNLFDRILNLGFGHVRRFRSGDLAHLIDQVHFVGHSANLANALAGQLLLLLVYAVALFWLSWRATLAAGLVAAVAFVALRIPIRRVRRFAEAYKDATVRLSEKAVELLGGLKTVLTFGAEKRALAAVEEEVERAAHATRQAVVAQAAVAPLTDIVAVLGIAVALVAGYRFVGLESTAALAAFATFLFVLYRAVPRVSIVNKSWANLNNYLPFFDRTAGFLAEEAPTPRADSARFEALRHAVRLRQVSFCYPDQSDMALYRVDMAIRPGQMTAVVGPSGAGKSTVVDLLLRIWEPTAGSIEVDGVPLPELDWDTWRGGLGVVSQGSFLFNDTVRANIALGREEAGLDQVVEAARLAAAHEFIMSLPQGYDTELGDQGHRLSGGQRQRIAIARAFLKEPDLLILDEATNELDSDTEARILNALRSTRAERAMLVVAHRLSTIAEADEILVMEAGRIVERGHHSELLSRGGLYSRLWAIQEVAAPSTATEPHEVVE